MPASYDIRYDIRDYWDLFAKFEREVARFDTDPSPDNLFNAMVTGWSLVDWIKSDPQVSRVAKDDLKLLTNRPAPNKPAPDGFLRLCADVATSSKHAVISHYEPSVSQVEALEGRYGEGYYGLGRYGGGRYYAIHTKSKIYDAWEILQGAITFYKNFFTRHGMTSPHQTTGSH
jgi:hypothetical protein